MKFLYQIWHFIASIPGMIKFKNRDPLSIIERDKLMSLFASGYYVILTGNRYHSSSVAVQILTFLKTGKWSRYSHALMNVSNLERTEDALDFKFMEATEATETGVHYATFEEICDCTDICILSPANMESSEWATTLNTILELRGKPYDDLFDMVDSTRFSCVELVIYALKKQGKYYEKFGNLEKLIRQHGTLTPQMFRDCSDFKVEYENE